MLEKHNFLVAMLDGMDQKVSSFSDKIISLEARIQTLEETENHQMNAARGIYQAANARQNDLEAKIKECATTIGENSRKCDIIEKLAQRIAQLESSSTSHPQTGMQHNSGAQNLSLAIYGLKLKEHENVIGAVNTLFTYMGLKEVRCRSAYRTPNKPEVDRLPVIIADLCSIEDKQAVLHRKRYLRAMPMYHAVFIKSSKTHTEQVMDANFSVMLKEISNGESYFISDNGRIRQRYGPSRRSDHDDKHNAQTYRSAEYSNGGARPKTNTYHDVARNRYAERNDNRYYPRITHNTQRRYSDAVARGLNDVRNGTYRPESNATVNNLYNEQRQTDDHTTLTTAYDTYAQQYINRFSNPQHNQHHNDAGRTVTQACSKN